MTESPSPPVRVGQQLELDVEGLAFGGHGVAHVEGFVVFVPRGLPGQRVRARIVTRKRGWSEARIEETLREAPDQVPARCRHFGLCGGCAWQHLAYARQVEAKGAQVRDCLVRLGGLEEPPLEAPIAAPDPFGYRNKMEFSFSDGVWRDEPGGGPGFGLGMHVRGRFDRVLRQEECPIAPDWMAEVAVTVREAAEASGRPPWAAREPRGFFRFLVLREGRNTGERMVNLITFPPAPGSDDAAVARRVLETVAERHPGITSLLHGTTASRATVAFCESWTAVAGPDVIHEELLGARFAIGPNTFFQTNTRQAERLFTTALDFAGPDVTEAWDLYCGVGALTLPLARRARRVVGVELVEASVVAARANAMANGVDNVRFVAADMKSAIRPEGLFDASGARVADRPDLVVVDPPRDGLHADVTAALSRLAPPRIVYVSCNPATLARDAARLGEGNYRMERAVAVDMFPHTAHVEMVAAFTRGS
jgi:23S rRNA (uracil1939-C5)-methyltransferase